MSYMENLGDILKGLLATQPGFREAWSLVRLEKSWPDIAGAELASYVRVADLWRGVLMLEVSNPAWASQMHFYKPTILEKIKQLLPDVEVLDIKTRVAEQRPIGEAKVAEKEIKPEEDVSARIEPLLEGLDPNSEAYKEMQSVLKKYVRWQEQDSRPACPICGQRFQGMDSICINCKNDDLQGQDRVIVEYLAEAPWSRYSELLEDVPGVKEDHYHRVKEKITARKRDKLQALFFEYTKTPTAKLKAVLEKEVLAFVMIKTGLPPAQVTEPIIKQYITSRLYTTLYK